MDSLSSADGIKARPIATVLARSSLRAWALTLLPDAAHNTYCAFASPINPGRSLLPTGSPLLGFIAHNMALCDGTAASPVTLTADPALASGGAVLAPVEPGSLHAIRLTLR